MISGPSRCSQYPDAAQYPAAMPSCGQGRTVSGQLDVGGFEEREFEGYSSTEEVAAQVRLTGADPVQLRAQEIDEATKIWMSCSAIHSACTKLSGSGFGAREAQSNRSPLLAHQRGEGSGIERAAAQQPMPAE
jgi:hypothetical protein